MIRNNNYYQNRNDGEYRYENRRNFSSNRISHNSNYRHENNFQDYELLTGPSPYNDDDSPRTNFGSTNRRHQNSTLRFQNNYSLNRYINSNDTVDFNNEDFHKFDTKRDIVNKSNKLIVSVKNNLVFRRKQFQSQNKLNVLEHEAENAFDDSNVNYGRERNREMPQYRSTRAAFSNNNNKLYSHNQFRNSEIQLSDKNKNQIYQNRSFEDENSFRTKNYKNFDHYESPQYHNYSSGYNNYGRRRNFFPGGYRGRYRGGGNRGRGRGKSTSTNNNDEENDKSKTPSKEEEESQRTSTDPPIDGLSEVLDIPQDLPKDESSSLSVDLKVQNQDQSKSLDNDSPVTQEPE